MPLDREIDFDLGMNPLAEYQAHSLQEARKLVERRGTLRGEPVVVDLAEVGVLAVTGERDHARSWARTLMNQLAAWRAPHDVRLLTAFEPEDAEAWEWGKWLPHQRVDPNVPGRFLFARSMGELDALLEPELRPRLEQLRRIAETDVGGREIPLVAPELVVILDGYHPDHPANELPAFRELLTRARQLKCVLILLCDARELEPSHIDARLTVAERGAGAWELWGQDAPSIPEVFLDQVDLGTSEATARTLTPLRLAEGGDGERGLSMNVRLVDLLGLPSADALDPETSWRPRPRALSLRAPIGRAADGEILELDLKQAAEGGMGPHGVLVGATGSGKSELLRSLVAGLAATHGPEQLAFVLVDYKGGAAFADLSRLPHVAGLITNLQRDLSLVDRMHAALIGEQERRQTMLREAGNLDDIVSYQARREADPSMPPMPDLLVIVDEFAELLTARPEFIDLFVGSGARGPLAGHPPAAVLAAARRGPPARPGEPPALPAVPAHVLGHRVQARARHAGRLPAAVDARPRLPEGRHREVRPVPRRAGLRPAPRRDGHRGGARAGARVRVAARDGAPAGGGRARALADGAERAAGARRPADRRPAARAPGVGGAAAGGRAARRRARRARRGGTAASAPRGCARWSAGSTARPSSAPSRSRSISPAPAATWWWSARRAPARARSCARWRRR